MAKAWCVRASRHGQNEVQSEHQIGGGKGDLSDFKRGVVIGGDGLV